MRQELIVKFSNLASAHLINLMDLLLKIGILSFFEKPLLIIG
jgi:hypothetical protein